MPAPWSPDGPPVVVCALAGRALAAAAVRAGYRPVVVDGFADDDTRALAAACHAVPPDGRGGLAPRPLAALADRLPRDVAVVYGSGFEGHPGRLAALARGRRLAGNPPDAVRAVRDPGVFFATLDRLGIPHPAVRRDPPADPAGWLAKRAGGSGGFGVRPAAAVRRAGRGHCFQRRAAGRPLSVQVLGDGRGVRLLAFTAGWCDPAPGLPWRFGGLAGPVVPSPGLAGRLAAAAVAVTDAFALKGLCSVDFLVAGDDALLLEVNPRPGASLDVLADDPLLFARHLAAFDGGPELAPPPPPRGGRAVAVVYARSALTVPPFPAWPAWSADRPAPGTAVPAGAPLCTVTATAADVAGAAAAARSRAARLLSALEAAALRPPPFMEDRHVPCPARS
ncbi:ATP-grasp domain-containing protein [Azospirillum halopraeferens]|uniref:ATP-grasp domain-containing protein n=1 Tax=Azospirillum halopraeferens TaxID=34010 RepID=UPI000686F94D|nr:ATP-grasp domain-containing protein [Azospirillum halopraeferens]